MKKFATPLSIRGDSLYCPLPFSLDAYYNCEPDCHHCYFRGLNHTWGKDFRAAEPEDVRKRLQNGLTHSSPKTPIAWAIRHRKTLRFGNKSDPFQPLEKRHRVSQKLLSVLTDLEWNFVVQTKFTDTLFSYEKEIEAAKSLIIFMPIISPGWDRDWEVFEKCLTTNPDERLRTISAYHQKGYRVGINGEPFIPGYHSIKDFEDTIKRVKSAGIKSYNTYNFHFTPFVAKRLADIDIDIEAIWYYNQDERWRPILQQLIDLGRKHNIVLGCPDFVNSGPDFKQPCNTCCGIDVDSPCTFNTHEWKRRLQAGSSIDDVLSATWDGIGDFEEGTKVLKGESNRMYTMADAGMVRKKKRGFLS